MPSNSLITVISVAILAGLSAQPVQAVDLERGRELHQNHCLFCHDTKLYARSHTDILSYEELRLQVDFWQSQTVLNWQVEDIEDVAFYLNELFYKLPCPHTPSNLC